MQRYKTLLMELRFADMQNATVHIVVDSPLAAEFTRIYRQLKPMWDAEAQEVLSQGRHPQRCVVRGLSGRGYARAGYSELWQQRGCANTGSGWLGGA